MSSWGVVGFCLLGCPVLAGAGSGRGSLAGRTVIGPRPMDRGGFDLSSIGRSASFSCGVDLAVVVQHAGSSTPKPDGVDLRASSCGSVRRWPVPVGQGSSSVCCSSWLWIAGGPWPRRCTTKTGLAASSKHQAGSRKDYIAILPAFRCRG
jgi:hypothetical protein